MGRAGGGGGVSRGGGGRSMGSRSGGSRSMGSRGGGGSRSFSSGGSGRSSFGGGGFNSFGGGMGGFGGAPHRPPHRPPRPIFTNYGAGHKTIIINNSGNKTVGTNTGSNTNTNNTGSSTYTSGNMAASQEYVAPKPLTTEQKINRAERLAEEARESRKGTAKILLIALILFVFGLFLSTKDKDTAGFEKYNLSGTVDVGYATDEINGASGVRKTEAACKEFYKETGIPLYFYITEGGNVSSFEDYADDLYNKLFQDENHVLLVYFDTEDNWTWWRGGAVDAIMNDGAVNELFDEIEVYWYDYSLSLDEVLAKGVKNYQTALTTEGEGAGAFGALLLLAGGILVVVAVYTYVSKGKEAKRYEEEAKTLRADLILSKPLETFGNQEVEDLKNKYDNM